jgi:hypothetical protein
VHCWVRRRAPGVRLVTQVATGNLKPLAILPPPRKFRVTGVDCGVYDLEVELLRAS